ncbi:malate dehydrogenase (quinone) [Reyranella sp.]|jgi:malate dehydrogenase (quinone)|uniref:malate dehydrogenase (quinone) n=1 Tax=Reyranella sp. TaxID=1929291 RepID=UPI000BC43920|nr:malate dehydrogenase (quinone) [Reyranella sp.]OYY36771.1 MAG: malate dehydrogenase (quinone) [Rhodospirillales bacterium 35-66-84]OYZ91709.1 MAG: malate dehydrogenase (quinone) [Rhodospirillales bacterium 24-66-33]OZB22756.1 MAG: malate dehydrogenase (quinone) [Rhodospirillales bacterium 39-66-50]HQS19063.1 malate dehydrogenase (quinone) [Reyranella sp.]HQT09954.1 malate dehydrogenase (quinone) [Reyranella sp.]
MADNHSGDFDVVLVGAGIMSMTLATFLKELQPHLKIQILERLEGEAQESSDPWNNAGTGHAANCELNYTPQRPDGSVDISKALEVNVEFDMSRQFWSYLVKKGAIERADSFIHPVPHMSFVIGADRAAFLKKRHATMNAHHCYRGMEYSEDHKQIAEWAPLLMEGRDPAQVVAATHMVTGSDVNYGTLTTNLLNYLRRQDGFSIQFNQEVTNLHRRTDGGWTLDVKDEKSGEKRSVGARRVFLGAGGAALTLLQKSGIPEADGFAGFPVSGIWLRSGKQEIATRHMAKVYGMAASGSPPMSVPHLDTRYVDGKRWLLFGPFAGFSTKFLKHGSMFDLPFSLRPDNLLQLLAVARDNLPLEEYLIGQVLQTKSHRFDALREFYPSVDEKDWEFDVAGQRVQIIRKDVARTGKLEFGTEIVHSADSSIVALLGASPGASTAVWIMVHMLETCFHAELVGQWVPKLKEMIPSYGQDLKTDAALVERVRKDTAEVLGLHTV